MNNIMKARVKKIFASTKSLKIKPEAILIKNGIEGQLDSTFFIYLELDQDYLKDVQ